MDMSSFLSGLFDFRSKEEKKRSYEAYSKLIFPYGDEQKERIAELLAGLFPKEKPSFVLMYYILVKSAMVGEEPVDFDTAVKKVKGSPMKSTPALRAGIRPLLEVDLTINENLEYPSLEELRAEVGASEYKEEK
jgi:hypothetical protein